MDTGSICGPISPECSFITTNAGFRVASFAEALTHEKVLMCDGVRGARNACHVRTDDVNIPY
jgi:hypothetical protein